MNPFLCSVKLQKMEIERYGTIMMRMIMYRGTCSMPPLLVVVWCMYDICTGCSYQGIVSPSSQLMKEPVLSIVMRLISWMTLLAPMLGSTAPSTSQMAWYLLVISVRLKPGCRIDTLTPEAFSSCDRSMPAMLAAALDM